MKKAQKFLALMSLLFFAYGCELALIGVGAGAGIASYKFIEGRLIQEYPLDLDRAWNSTNKALESLKVSISDSIKGVGKGTINAVKEDGRKVRITFKVKGPGVTSIAIRVGGFGDRVEAMKIHEKIVSVAGI